MTGKVIIRKDIDGDLYSKVNGFEFRIETGRHDNNGQSGFKLFRINHKEPSTKWGHRVLVKSFDSIDEIRIYLKSL